MKKPLCIALAVLLFAFSGLLVRAETTLSLTVPSKTGGVGSILIFPVSLSGNRSLAGFQFHIDYDPAFLELVSASVEMSGGYKIVNKSEGGVELIWTAAQPYTGNGVIASLSFKLLREGRSRLYLLADSENGEGFYSYENGVFHSYELNAPPALVTCTNVLPCDVDLDGLVSIADATALLNVLEGSALPAGNCDLDGDGDVSISDVSYLLNILAS